MRQLIILFVLILIFYTQIIAQKSNDAPNGSRVFIGNELLLSKYLNKLDDKRIGIVTNQTGKLQDGTHIVDALLNIPNLNITALYAPEHGIRGDAPAGKEIKNGIDIKSQLPVYSLYGKNKKPSSQMLTNVDLLLFDIQDIGARFYTYISTLYYLIEAASENSKEIIVLDRPNPISGDRIAGPIIDKKYISFLGIAPLPIQHGLTMGEIANYFNDLIYKKSGKRAALSIIKMENWKREMFFNDCQLLWSPTSPNIPNLETAVIYPGMCLIEGINVSEGRGTDSPFLQVGAPWFDSKNIISELKKLNLKGVQFHPSVFTPVNIKGKAYNPKFKNEKCYGIMLQVEEFKNIEAIKLGVSFLYSIHKVHPKELKFLTSTMNLLFGNDYLESMIIDNKTPDEIIEKWKSELNNFIKIRERYLLY